MGHPGARKNTPGRSQKGVADDKGRIRGSWWTSSFVQLTITHVRSDLEPAIPGTDPRSFWGCLDVFIILKAGLSEPVCLTFERKWNYSPFCTGQWESSCLSISGSGISGMSYCTSGSRCLWCEARTCSQGGKLAMTVRVDKQGIPA